MKQHNKEIFDAIVFAVHAHKGQQYGEGVPYLVHLSRVAQVLEDFGYTAPHWQKAAYLHDTVEDTSVTHANILEFFGYATAELVFAVTGHGTREEQQRQIKNKLINFPTACILKIADRIANVEYGLEQKGDHRHFRKYLKENEDFETYIRPNVPKEMWMRLDAAFKRGIELGYHNE